jgi:hypothetical protein
MQPGNICGNATASPKPGKPTPFSSFGGGGGGGGGTLSITRTQIPFNNLTNVTSVTLVGYSTPNDLGYGAVYNCVGQTSTSTLAIQDNVGNWCALAATGGMRDINIGWFGADPTGSADSAAAIQAAIDYGFNNNVPSIYCPAGTYKTTLPIFFDPPGNLRGGGPWFNANFPYGSIVTYLGQTWVNNFAPASGVPGLSYVRQSWGAPGDPFPYGLAGTDVSYQIVSSTSAVTYNPGWISNTAPSSAVVATFKGSGITAPTTIVDTDYIQNSGSAYHTTASVPGGATIIVGVTVGTFPGDVSAVSDQVGNTYTKVAGVTSSSTIVGASIWVATGATALPSGNTITATLTGGGTNYRMGAVYSTAIAGGLDKTATASVANGTTNTSISVTTPVLSQANELIFAVVRGPANINVYPYVQAAGFTSVYTQAWSNQATWNAGTTYSSGQYVLYNGLPFSSLTNGNINNSPGSDIGYGIQVNWSMTYGSGPQFAFNGLFHGPGALDSTDNTRASCWLQQTFNNTIAFTVGPGNGMTVKSVSVRPQNLAYNCALPYTGVGFMVPGGGGGANRTELDNIGVVGFYIGVGLGGVGSYTLPALTGLGAENRLVKPKIGGDVCIGVEVLNSQAFINQIIDGEFTANTAVWLPFSAEMTIIGGNYSVTSGAPATAFALAATPTFDGTTLTGTITSPDSNQSVTCTGGGSTFWDYTPNTPATTCLRNIYNAWTVMTPDFGVVPFVPSSYNSSTHVGTWKVLGNYTHPWATNNSFQPNAQFQAEVITAVQSKFYAAEMERTFIGNGFVVENAHVETNAPNEFAAANSGYGSALDSVFTGLLFNGEVSKVSIYTPGDDPSTAQFYAQQSFPFIDMSAPFGNIRISDSFAEGSDAVMLDYSNPVGVNAGFLTIQGGWNAPLNMRGTIGSSVFSATYGGLYSVGFGGGSYDHTVSATGNPQTIIRFGGTPATYQNDVNINAQQSGWASAPYVGVRPAPWTRPCIAPRQYANLLNPPAITGGPSTYAVQYPTPWSGQQYGICDWSLAPTAYNAGTTYVRGNIVSSGGSNYFSLADSNTGNTPASSPTFWKVLHYGLISNHGVGFSYGQNLTTSNVPSLSWTVGYNAPFLKVNDASLLFPGLSMVLTPSSSTPISGGGTCSTSPETFVVTEAHYTLNYVVMVNAQQDITGAPSMLPAFNASGVCGAATIGQQSFVFTDLN